MTGGKADYVRARVQAGHDGRHLCHWPGCGVAVAPAQWGCRRHWYALPKRLRTKIWRVFRPGQEVTKTPSADYVAVAREVQDWIAAQQRQQGELL